MASSSVRGGLVVVPVTTTGGWTRAGEAVGVCGSAAGARSTTVSAANSGIRIGGEVLESGSPARTERSGRGFHPLCAGTDVRGEREDNISLRAPRRTDRLVRFGSEKDPRADLLADVRVDRGA